VLLQTISENPTQSACAASAVGVVALSGKSEVVLGKHRSRPHGMRREREPRQMDENGTTQDLGKLLLRVRDLPGARQSGTTLAEFVMMNAEGPVAQASTLDSDKPSRSRM